MENADNIEHALRDWERNLRKKVVGTAVNGQKLWESYNSEFNVPENDYYSRSDRFRARLMYVEYRFNSDYSLWRG